MVCLSGGKDSYTLLDILLSLQRSAPIDFELIAVNLDQKQPDFPAGSAAQLPARHRRAVPRDRAGHLQRRQARDPRGQDHVRPVLAAAARRAVSLRGAKTASPRSRSGHHRDDIVETLFLNLFFGGRLKAMAPKLRSEDGRHIVIRPLAYVGRGADRALRARARSSRSFPASCAARRTTRSARQVKRMLAEWEREYPGPHRVDLLRAAQRRAGAPRRSRDASISQARLPMPNDPQTAR